MRCTATIPVVFCLLLVMVGAVAAQGTDPGWELPPGIDLDMKPTPVPGAPSGGNWEPAPVLPDGAVPGMPTDLPPGVGGEPQENPLDKTFKSALHAYRGQDYVNARELWGELSDAGHELSIHNLGVLLWRGQGGPRDRALAVEKFQEAEDKNVPQSAHALGVINLYGIGMPRDLAAAMRHFEIGTELDHAPSAYNLALARFQGLGVPKDPAMGMQLMTKAAGLGLTRAQYDLASLLVAGTYGPKDPAKAREWYAKAAKGGDAVAHYNLAVMLQDGVGGPVDMKASLDHLRTSAEAGVAPAQRQLGYVLASGPNRDLAAAMGWFIVAAEIGDKTAQTNVQRLKPRLDAKTLKAAEKWARAFRPKTLEPEIESNPEKRTEK